MGMKQLIIFLLISLLLISTNGCSKNNGGDATPVGE